MTNSLINIFRKNLKFYRNKKGLTQEKLSEISGISSDYISEIERGKKTPSFKRIVLISQALDLEIYKLFMENE